MKTRLLTSLMITSFGLCGAFAQVSIPNGALENWNSNPMEEPQFYFTANTEITPGQFTTWPVTKTTDAYLNSYAIRMETQGNAVGDTMFGYFANGDPGNGTGGIPYTETPSSISGYWKGSIMPGDTAIFLVIFKSSGTAVAFGIHQFYGTQSAYTSFTLPINFPPMATPDSVIIAAASSNAFVFNGIAGSWLQIDNISFNAPSQPSQMNGDFELWNTVNNFIPVDWQLLGDSAERTTDAYQGQYAVSLETFWYGSGGSPSWLTNGRLNQTTAPTGGFPFTNQVDTLVAYYKYTPAAIDSAFIVAVFTKANPLDTFYAIGYMVANANYTMLEVPVNLPFVPDSVAITVGSTWDLVTPSDVGSLLIVDEIQFKSQALTTNVQNPWTSGMPVLLYPNPTTDRIFIEATGGYTVIRITDINGRVVYEENNEVPVSGRRELSLAEYGSGMYFVTVINGEKAVTRKISLQ